MKTLYLIRHAKSSWAFDLPDHDRPLGKRGRKDVTKIGQHLSIHHDKPEMIISSTASRAFYTALHIADHWGIDEGSIRLNQHLFHAGAHEILNEIKQAPNSKLLAIVGHNPGFTSLANALTNSSIDNIPTGGVVGISFACEKWSDIDYGMGKQQFFLYPKGI